MLKFLPKKDSKEGAHTFKDKYPAETNAKRKLAKKRLSLIKGYKG